MVRGSVGGVERGGRGRLATAVLLASSLVVAVLVGVLIGGWIKYTVDLKRERDLAEVLVAERRRYKKVPPAPWKKAVGFLTTSKNT